MQFMMDDGGGAFYNDVTAQSTIYTLLTLWRALVRAGRGPVGSETAVLLDKYYNASYRFPIYVYLVKGTAPPPSYQPAEVIEQLGSEQIAWGGYETSGIYKLDNAWLTSFKLGELTYERSVPLLIEATFHADNIISLAVAEGKQRGLGTNQAFSQ